MAKIEWTADDFYSFLKDPVFMHKVIFDKDLPPHQQAMLKGMWFRPFYCDTSGYRAAKSRTATYCQMMQSILISGWMDGIFSHSKRGSDILFREHIDQEYADNPRFRIFVARTPSHRDEGSRCIYKNGSQNIAYPADVLGGGQKLESISLHAATVDEFTAIPKPDIIWNVFINRITMPMPRVARLLGITNNVRLIGAAKYSFQLVYQKQGERGGLVKMVIKKMVEQGRKYPGQPLEYLFQTFNLRYLPRDEVCYCGGPTEDDGVHDDGHSYVQCRRCGMRRIAWRVFFKGALMRMNDVETLMTKVLFAMRWLGIWQRVSEELYSGHAVENMKNPGCFVELSRPLNQKKAIYVMGIDVARGRRTQSSVSAITIIKRVPPDPFYYVVYSKKHRLNLTELSGEIYALYEKFSPSVIMIDPGGGGNWLVDNDHLGANKQTLRTASGRVQRETMPLLMMDAPPMERGARVLQLWQHNMKILKESLGTLRYSDELMNWAHGVARGFINDARILRPVSDILEDGSRYQKASEIFTDIEEAATGLPQIGIVQDENGTPLLTSHNMFQYNPKPDLAYSLIYAVCAMYLFTHEKRAELEEENEEMAAISAALESVRYPENAAEALKIVEPDDEEMVFLSSDSQW
jgi:hypothetical protein